MLTWKPPTATKRRKTFGDLSSVPVCPGPPLPCNVPRSSDGRQRYVFSQDFLDVNALCAGSMAAITTGAAAIAPYGAAVHAACANNHFLKTPKSQAQLSALWNSPGYDPVSGLKHPRRLTEEEEMAAKQPLKESLAQIAENRETLEQLKKVTDVPKPGNTEADMETLLNLMGGEDNPHAAWPFEC